ncbi:MAG: biotin-dependent carboxyltransferase family protein [Marivita sp.]|uniref:5-oxoprolinase subunit C family protein n=1 Tax=Marivita sp. TaxID=2003365 RepID=UPI001B0A056B|nr:biotin-dependent carboxyltransferase family protein [Marivita sp.]MBO6882958.1 biotin-dependent carboxyltransferase family protein [Marivita sp.]
MTIEIHSASPMLTVQDAGRSGLRRFGVSTAGPIDPDAMALANALCANPPMAAALEFAGPGCALRSDTAIRFAVAGADCDIRVGDRRLASGESHVLAPGETLRLGAPQGAVWAYLALSGGLDMAPVLGSRATHLRSGLGGVEGRSLRPSDRLGLGPQADAPCLRLERPLKGTNLRDLHSGPIRLILGPQSARFAPETLERLLSEPFQITPQRDRMAMVLGGVELPATGGHDIVSDGTVPGSIQVPGSGLPLVLLAESQTTGGYPKIATVASVDLPRLAQMPVGASVRFALISRDEGEALWIAQQRQRDLILGGLIPKAPATLSSELLLSCDLVGGIAAPREITGTDLDLAEDPR